MFEQLQFSEVLVQWRRFFNFLADQQGKSEMLLLEQKLELEQLKVCVCVCVDLESGAGPGVFRSNGCCQFHTQPSTNMSRLCDFTSDRVGSVCFLSLTAEMFILQESLTKLGVGPRDDIENWFTGEKLGLSG